MIVNIWPGIFGGKDLGLPGRNDIVIEDFHCSIGKGNTTLRKIVAFDLDLCLILHQCL